VHDSLILRSAPPDAPWLDGRVTDLVSTVVQFMSLARVELTDVGPGAREIVLAEDFTAAVRALDGGVHIDGTLQDFVPERLGGLVVGKTLFRNEDHSRAVITMDARLFQADDDLALVGQVFLLGHELAHALIGQLRRANGYRMAPAFRPWDTSRWITRYALEEYKADVIAQIMLRQFGSVSTTDGETRELRSTDYREGREEWVQAAATTTLAIAKAIHDYRIGEIELGAMWESAVQPMTSDMLIALAHAQAEADEIEGCDEIATEPVAAIAPPLHRLWSTFTDIARGFCILQSADGFHVEEQAALDSGRDALLEFWNEMGLTFSPHGETFYISVAAPHLAWRPATAA
jgi:hypothetical protein